MPRYIHLIIVILLSLVANVSEGAQVSYSLSEYERWAKLSTRESILVSYSVVEAVAGKPLQRQSAVRLPQPCRRLREP